MEKKYPEAASLGGGLGRAISGAGSNPDKVFGGGLLKKAAVELPGAQS